IPGGIREHAGLRPEPALEENALAKQRREILGAPRSPNRVAERLLPSRAFVVDDHHLERRGADDEIVELRVTMHDPAPVQRGETLEPLLEQPKQPGGDGQRELARLAEVLFFTGVVERRETAVRDPWDQAASERVLREPDRRRRAEQRARLGLTLVFLTRVAVEPPGVIRFAEVQRVLCREGK